MHPSHLHFLRVSPANHANPHQTISPYWMLPIGLCRISTLVDRWIIRNPMCESSNRDRKGFLASRGARMVWTPRFRGGRTRKTGGTGRTGPPVCGGQTIRVPLSGDPASNREGEGFPPSRGARMVWTPRIRGGRTPKTGGTGHTGPPVCGGQTIRVPLSGAAASNREGEGFPVSYGSHFYIF